MISKIIKIERTGDLNLVTLDNDDESWVAYWSDKTLKYEKFRRKLNHEYNIPSTVIDEFENCYRDFLEETL